MELQQNRRRFLKHCSQLGVICCALLSCGNSLFAEEGVGTPKPDEKDMIDPAKLAYCSLACEQCELYKATQEGNTKVKEKVYREWGLQLDGGFDAEKVVCYACKSETPSPVLDPEKCTVRQCAVSNEFESCIECQQLVSCEDEFWKRWSGLYSQAKTLQKQYAIQPGVTLKDLTKKKNDA